jgi:predicted CXXCH cytochrome family protein
MRRKQHSTFNIQHRTLNRYSLGVGRWALDVACFLFCVLALATVHADTIVNSKHNLSVSGPGTIKATSQSDVCIFCHTAHHSTGATPLWNHNFSGVTNYIVYSSTTLDALGVTIPQPNGSSRLCLSCHDGTIALGSINSRTTPLAMQNGVTTMPTGPSNLGTDLSGDHPISFVYDSALAAKDPQVKDPATLTGKVKLDHEGRLQCTACHDPHDNQFGNFLVMDNTASAICLTCHNVSDWSSSAHAMSSKTVLPTPLTAAKSSQATALKVTTIAAQGCANCHTPHFAGSKERLMKFAAPEQNCLPCHNGSTAGVKNVAADFQKISIHPVTQNSAAHGPKEDAINPPSRHVTCADCHNPHASKPAPAATMASARNKVSESLAGVTGVNASGAVMKSSSKEYELCLRCHGDSLARGQARVNRQLAETNKRLQFNTANESFHPVESVGKNRNVPSLIAPLNTSSLVTCTDCHNSDQSPGAGGSGANGPHGSIYPPLLERQLVLTDFTAENPASYALCYKCHSRDSILADQSFRAVNSQGQSRGHRFHIVDQKTACTTCHDSHGTVTAKHLINFNRDYVTPSTSLPLIQYTSTGSGSGNCTLSCHGADHAGTSYPSSPAPARLQRGRK